MGRNWGVGGVCGVIQAQSACFGQSSGVSNENLEVGGTKGYVFGALARARIAFRMKTSRLYALGPPPSLITSCLA